MKIGLGVFAASTRTERIGKLCNIEGVVAFFWQVLTTPLESGLTPSKRSRMVASEITAIDGY